MAQGALRMSRALRFAPLALLLLVIVALVWRLATPTDNNVPSKLEGKPVPAFDLGPALDTKPALSSRDLATGHPHLLNIFASWCVPCVGEVKVLQRAEGARHCHRRHRHSRHARGRRRFPCPQRRPL